VTWFLHALFVTACAALLGAATSVALLFFRRWVLAQRLAKRAMLVAMVVLGIGIAEVQVLWTAPGVVAPLIVRALPAGDPSVTARALGEAISEIMSSLALAIPALVLGGIGWAVSTKRAQRRVTGRT
jgi:hypothetical protein